MWVFDQIVPDSNAHTIGVAAGIVGSVDPAVLQMVARSP